MKGEEKTIREIIRPLTSQYARLLRAQDVPPVSLLKKDLPTEFHPYVCFAKHEEIL